MCKYIIECFNETNKMICFVTESADGYCAEIKIRKRFPTYKIGRVVKVEEIK